MVMNEPVQFMLEKYGTHSSFCKITDRAEGTNKLQTLPHVVGEAVKRWIIQRIHFQKQFPTVDVSVSVFQPQPLSVLDHHTM